MTSDVSILGSRHAVDGGGVVRMRRRFDAGIDDVWGAVTEPARLADWYGQVEGDLSVGGGFRVQIALAGVREGRVEACDPGGICC
jgi:uncharacterized protein YndB with AHSA1/START domain